MRAKELMALSLAELNAELDKLLQQHFNLRLMKGTKQEIKPHAPTAIRRAIARVKTVMTLKKMKEGE